MKKHKKRIAAVVVMIPLTIFFALSKQNYAQQADEPAKPFKAPVRQGPELLVPGEHGIGGFIADLEFTDLADKQHRLSEFSGKRAVVIAWYPKAFTSGYDKGKSDAVKQQYWLQVAGQRQRNSEGNVHFYPVQLPEQRIDGVIFQPSTKYLQQVEPAP